MAAPSFRRSSRRRRLIWAGAAVVALIVIVGALVFEPWTLVIDRHVDQPFPGAETSIVARGSFISHEHASSGTALVVKQPDGSSVLRLQDLDTSDGPRLQVWLSDSPVVEGSDGWYVFDDGAHVDLGELAGNVGSSNYAIPASADLGKLTSVTIWCDRFNVSFAAATLQPTT